MDGAAWSEPVAEGQGQNPTTTIALKPVPARFVRITQTGHAGDGGAVGDPTRADLQPRSSRVEALTAMALQSINPATGETLATFDTLAPAEVMDAARARDRGVSGVEEHAVRRAGAAAGARRRHPRERIRKRSGG